ncbi:hypothetical protein [Neobacillus niacini]|uniref:hypothetical protein n=1 Tax=Neobacillus niacini TaxID=86668 RepID=UPI0021CAF71B|nr:hypothetical protein [Neobacillus niacini]MCM3764624.1 hypothetical protein [Neobacillus niacini]
MKVRFLGLLKTKPVQKWLKVSSTRPLEDKTGAEINENVRKNDRQLEKQRSVELRC